MLSARHGNCCPTQSCDQQKGLCRVLCTPMLHQCMCIAPITPFVWPVLRRLIRQSFSLRVKRWWYASSTSVPAPRISMFTVLLPQVLLISSTPCHVSMSTSEKTGGAHAPCHAGVMASSRHTGGTYKSAESPLFGRRQIRRIIYSFVARSKAAWKAQERSRHASRASQDREPRGACCAM